LGLPNNLKTNLSYSKFYKSRENSPRPIDENIDVVKKTKKTPTKPKLNFKKKKPKKLKNKNLKIDISLV